MEKKMEIEIEAGIKFRDEYVLHHLTGVGSSLGSTLKLKEGPICPQLSAP